MKCKFYSLLLSLLLFSGCATQRVALVNTKDFLEVQIESGEARLIVLKSELVMKEDGFLGLPTSTTSPEGVVVLIRDIDKVPFSFDLSELRIDQVSGGVKVELGELGDLGLFKEVYWPEGQTNETQTIFSKDKTVKTNIPVFDQNYEYIVCFINLDKINPNQSSHTTPASAPR